MKDRFPLPLGERGRVRGDFAVLTVLTVFLCSGGARAVPPFPGIPQPKGPTCFVNPRALAERTAILKKFAPGFAPPIAPTTYNIAVLRVQFQDLAMTQTLPQAQAEFLSFAQFYQEDSFGLLTVNTSLNDNRGEPQGPFTVGTVGTYAGGINSNYAQLATDAVNAARAAGFDFTPYNHLMILHAGQGAETATNPNSYIWSVYDPLGSNGVTGSPGYAQGVERGPSIQGITFPGATFTPESEFQTVNPLGVTCHEYGHQLGMPDLYNTATGNSVNGKWDVQDFGLYNGSPPGSNPAHHGAWSKQFLGFSNPQAISFANSLSTTVFPAESTRNAFIRLPIDASSVGGNNEYFLLEYRRNSSSNFDLGLPGAGLLIWHVDDSVASNPTRLNNNDVNSGTPNPGVAVVEADPPPDLSTSKGDAGDPFPGSTGNSSFSTPLSNPYNGSQSGLVVAGIAGAGNPFMTMSITKLAASATLDVAKVTNYPNPAGPSYPRGARAAQDTVTTLVFQYTRPFLSAKLSIHDLSGALVRSVPQSSIQLQAGPGKPSGDYKWVYEYNWDGKNDDGQLVSSGIYLYRITADDNLVRTGKIVIIR